MRKAKMQLFARFNMLLPSAGGLFQQSERHGWYHVGAWPLSYRPKDNVPFKGQTSRAVKHD